MRPAAASVVQTIRLTGVDAARFVGGGMDRLDSDVACGSWVRASSTLAGTPRPARTRAAGSVSAGRRHLQRLGPPRHPTKRAHPEVNGQWTAEVTTSPATSASRARPVDPLRPIRHMSALKGTGTEEGKSGRYGLHFHMMGDANRGAWWKMGHRNTIRNSTAVGVGGTAGSAGFGWPEDAGQNTPGASTGPREIIDFVESQLSGTQFSMKNLVSGTRIRVQNGGSALQLDA